MSRVRVHNFSISLDGFGTGEGVTFDAYFGHAGEPLHERLFATRFWRSTTRQPGRHTGVDDAPAERHTSDIGAETIGPASLGHRPSVNQRRRRPGMARRVGPEPAVPHAGLRSHPPSPAAHRDGGRDRLPLRRRQPQGGARGRQSRRRRSRRAIRRERPPPASDWTTRTRRSAAPSLRREELDEDGGEDGGIDGMGLSFQAAELGGRDDAG
jgi:hypothetical protein